MCQITVLLMVLATICVTTCAQDENIKLQTKFKRSPSSNPIFASVFNNVNPSKSLAEKFFEGSRNRDKLHWTITHEAPHKEHHKEPHKQVSKEPCSTEKPRIVVTKPIHEKPEPHHPKPHYEHHTHKPSDKHEPPKATSWVHFYQSIKNTHGAPKHEEKHYYTHDTHHAKDSGYSVEYWPKRPHHEVTKSPESHLPLPPAALIGSPNKNLGYSVEYWPKRPQHEVTKTSESAYQVYIPPAASVSSPKKEYGYSAEHWPKKTHYESPKSTVTQNNLAPAAVYSYHHKSPEATSFIKYSSSVSKKTDAVQNNEVVNSYGQHVSPYVYQKYYKVPQVSDQPPVKQQATSYATYTNSLSKNTNGGSHYSKPSSKPYLITEYHGEQAQNTHIGKPNYYVSNSYRQSPVHGLPNKHNAQGATSYAKYSSSISNNDKAVSQHAYFSEEHQKKHEHKKEATKAYNPAEANLFTKYTSVFSNNWQNVQQGIPTTKHINHPAVHQVDLPSLKQHSVSQVQTSHHIHTHKPLLHHVESFPTHKVLEKHDNKPLSGDVKYQYGLPGDGSFVKFSSSTFRR